MKPRHTPLSARRERGVIMVVALVTLVVLLIGAAAMIRSMNSSLSATGSYGFKRDMSNQGARALANVRALMITGVLATDVSRQSSLPSENYSATMLATSVEGIPTVLLGTDSAFDTSGVASSTRDIRVDDLQVRVRYVIDRLCVAGTIVAKPESCMMSSAAPSPAIVCRVPPCKPVGPVPQVVYRLTVRVNGPRNAQSFFQSTFSL